MYHTYQMNDIIDTKPESHSIPLPRIKISPVDYSPDLRTSALCQSTIEWYELKKEIDKIPSELTTHILNWIDSTRLQRYHVKFTKFIKDRCAQVILVYGLIATLNSTFKENENLLDYNATLRDIAATINQYFIEFNRNLLAIAKHNFVSKIYLDTKLMVEYQDQELDSGFIFISNPEITPQIEKLANKRISDSDLKEIVQGFEEKASLSLQKKIESVKFNLKHLVETYYSEALNDASDQAGRILAKLTFYSNNEGAQDATVNEVTNNAIDEFFLKKYPKERESLQKKLDSILDEQAIAKAETAVISKFIEETTNNKEKLSTKRTLDEFFMKNKAAYTLEVILSEILTIVKHATLPKKIHILDAEKYESYIASKEAGFIKVNNACLLRMEDNNGEEEQKVPEVEEIENLLFITNEELIKDKKVLEGKLSFFPRNLEFPKEEANIIFFFFKLVDFFAKTQDSNPSDAKSMILEIDIGSFVSFTLRFLAELSVIESEANGLQEGYFEPTYNRRESMLASKHIDSVKSTPIQRIKEDASIEYLQHQENFGLKAGKVTSIECFEDIDFIDLTESDSIWENSDNEVFEKLLELTQCKLLNDCKTLKQVSGLNDYVFLDKNDSLELFKEFVISQKNRTDPKEIAGSPMQKLLSAYNPEITKGIVFIFVPAPSLFNLVAIRIDFEAKTRRFVALETQNVDLSTLNDLINDFVKFIKKIITMKSTLKHKMSQFKQDYIILKYPSSMEGVELQGFKNFYFPYIGILNEDANTEDTDVISVENLKHLLCVFLQKSFTSAYGLEQIRSLLHVYQLYANRFSNLFIMEEFLNLDGFSNKIQKYLSLCFIDNLQSNSQKLKSITLFGRIYNEKLRSYDFILVYFEYKHYTQAPLMILKNNSNDQPGNMNLQNFYVFGDTYLHVMQVRSIIKAFFAEREHALKRLRFSFYQMKKSKGEASLLLMDKTLVYCLISILVNEGLQINHILSICRLSPAIQYKYFSLTLERIRSFNQAAVRPRKDIDIDVSKTVKVSAPKGVQLIEETYNTISILSLNQPDTLRWLVDLTHGNKFIVVNMIPSGKNDAAFKVNMQDIKFPADPVTVVLVNPQCDAGNPNLCNIIEPDGTVFILRITTEGQNQKADKIPSGILKSVEQVQKALPKNKSNYKVTVISHLMYLKHFTFQAVKVLFDFMVVLYLRKYKTSVDQWFVVSENSILSLFFADLRVCFREVPESARVVQTLIENRFIQIQDTIVERSHKYYNEDSLIAIFGLWCMSKAAQSLVFSIQNDVEYSFHVVIKSHEPSAVIKIIVISLRDQSAGQNAASFYQDNLNLLEEGVFSSELQCEYSRIELGTFPSYFYSVDQNVLVIALADHLCYYKGNDHVDDIKQYLQSWYQPTLLSTQLIQLGFHSLSEFNS